MDSLKKSLSVLSAMAMACLFAACDSDSTSASNDESASSSSEAAESSSSVILSDREESSSSVNGNSSSSVAASLSSAVTLSSSSSVIPGSSSAVTPSNVEGSSSSVASGSSSSVIPDPDRESSSSAETLSSSSKEIESSSSELKSAWAYLNPAISYGEFTDERDGQVYKSVKIGDQVWMAENLNYADSVVTTSLKGKSGCYNDQLDSCAKYGRLYTWAAAIDSVALANDADNPQICGVGKECDRLTSTALAVESIQGLCPKGWHLPSDTEWRILFEQVGGKDYAGKVLRSSSGWWSNGGGEDTYGFSALPGGYMSNGGSFYYARSYANFWSASQCDDYDAIGAFAVDLRYGTDSANLSFANESYGFSVRCVKD